MNILEEHIRSKIISRVYHNNNDITDLLVEALLQQDVAPSTYISSIHKDTVSKKYKVMFGKTNKPSKTRYNTWFLYEIGLKRCCSCRENKSLDSFSADATSWDSKQHYCFSCANAWKVNNSGIINAINSKRRAAKLSATPSWLTKEQLLSILEFYKEAKKLEMLTGIKYHVDHIVPLQGANVCGLHVPWNLQVIPAVDNIRKHNKWQN